MREFNTLTGFLLSTTSDPTLDPLVSINGYAATGDGGAAMWEPTGVTGQTASLSPYSNGFVTDASGNQYSAVVSSFIKPSIYGFGDVALNVAFNVLRQSIIDGSDKLGSFTLDGGNFIYQAANSVNATLISGWNYKIQNLSIFGTCTGKAVLDLTGSRGGTLDNVSTFGDETLMPSTGIQFGRSTASTFGFCGNWAIKNCTTIGWYTDAGFYGYAQETTHYDHNRFWNYNHEARAAIFSGFNVIPYLSDFTTPVTGSASYICNNYTNNDIRFLPSGNTFVITNITQANPAVVTVTGTIPWATGEQVVIDAVNGMVEINHTAYTITVLTTSTFELDAINSTGFTAYTNSGNAVIKQDLSPMYFARGEQHTFDSHYVVSYGQPQVEFAFVDTLQVEQIEMNMLFEGSGYDSHVKFTGVDANTSSISGFKFKVYNTKANVSLFSKDGTTVIDMSNVEIHNNGKSTGYNDIKVFDAETKYGCLNANIGVPDSTLDAFSTLNELTGTVSDKNGLATQYDVVGASIIDGTWTPTITAQTGTYTTVTVNTADFTVINGLCFMALDFTIDDIGTGTGYINVTTPVDGLAGYVLLGKEIGGSGVVLSCQFQGTNSAFRVRKHDNSTTFANGFQAAISQSYKVS